MLNIAIIGSGGIAKSRHIPSIQESQLARLAGVYNRSYRHSQQDAKALDCKAYGSLEELWRDSAVDAVIVCTPTSSHAALSIQALQSGKHVLCEKPMALTATEARGMVEAERHSGKKLMISHNQRFYNPHQKVRELLKEGVIGKLHHYRTFLGVHMPMEGPPSQDQNAVAEVGSHRIDLLRYLLEDEVTEVFAHLTRWNAGTGNEPVAVGDDSATVLLRHRSGLEGTLITSRISCHWNDRQSVFLGSEGAITLYGQQCPVVVETRDRKRMEYPVEVPPQSGVERTDIVERFFRCIIEDSPVPVPAKDGLAVIQVLDAIYQSNRQKCWQRVQ